MRHVANQGPRALTRTTLGLTDSYCLLQAVADEQIWSESVRHPAAAWVAAGARSELLTPEESYGARALPGGKEAMKV
eukprot:3080920-Amphidinium_carterae.1